MASCKEIQESALWPKLVARGAPLSFDLEITARCNNDCRHCYINLPAGDPQARAAELSARELVGIAEQAAGMGAVWCLVTGGEPLLRDDFADLYLGLKRLGLLVSVFTNACLVTPAHVALFKRYPPRDLEVTVYGATRSTYEAVTRRPGSYEGFVRGLDLLMAAGVRVRLKAMALRSTIGEIEAISRFCRERTKDFYRFDPLVHLRLDGDPVRNAEIRQERLSPEEVVALERSDVERFGRLRRECLDEGLLAADIPEAVCDGRLFRCGAGLNSFTVGYDGTFRLCGSLSHPQTVYDLRQGSLREAWEEWVPRVRASGASAPGFLERCGPCALVNLCHWCPAHAALETGAMDEWVEYFCTVAHARASSLRQETEPESCALDHDR